MGYYWEPSSTTEKSPSSGRKIAALMIILMLIISSGIVILFNLIPEGLIPGPSGTQGNIRVAVIDSGLDVDFAIASRVGPQQSFISTANGYDETDDTTADSNPEDGSGSRVRHGTLVSNTILEQSVNVEIAVAKVIDSDGFA
ncbi:MAG: hypothetical protein ACXAEF_07920, partial [Candidatus Thorarchaeota archaeon]